MAMLAYEAAPRPRVIGLRMPGIGGLGPSDALGDSPRPRGIPDSPSMPWSAAFLVGFGPILESQPFFSHATRAHSVLLHGMLGSVLPSVASGVSSLVLYVVVPTRAPRRTHVQSR